MSENDSKEENQSKDPFSKHSQPSEGIKGRSGRTYPKREDNEPRSHHRKERGGSRGGQSNRGNHFDRNEDQSDARINRSV